MKENMSQDELKKMRRMSYIKMAAMVGIVVAVLAFGSIAWFTMSREVEGTGTQMVAEKVPFELMVSGDITNNAMFEYVTQNDDPIYKLGNLFRNTEKQFITAPDEEHMQIRWAGGSDEGLEPGKYGDLTFYIVPNEMMTAADFVARYKYLKMFQVNIKGYRTVETENASTGKKEVTDLTDIETLPAFQPTLPYLNGHILFFKTRTITRDSEDENVILSEKYTGLIDTTDRFALEDTDYTIENGLIKVVLHWKWPTTFPQMIGTYSVTENIAGDSATTTALIRYSILHADRVLFGKNAQTIADEDTVNETLLLRKMGEQTPNDLSKLYNKADSRIGADVQYVMFVLNARYQ